MRSLLVLLFALSCSWGAQTWLVCAGVEKYRDERITPLQFAVADAKATAAAFRAAGVSHRTLTLLTSDSADPEHQPTRINLLTALEHVKERATREDKVVVFFAGHGTEQDGQQFLLSSDTRLSLLSATALPMALVNEALRGLQAQEVLFLLDACRNDPNSGRAQADAALTETLARGLRPQLAGQPDAPRPRLVATLLACEVGQRAWEDPEAQHGVFTEYLLQGLAGQAAEAGAVKLSSLSAYVSRQLRDWSARTGKPQAPKLVNPEGGDMVVLVPPSEPVVSVAFSNRTLAEVIGELGEQYGAQITLGRGADPNAKVTGRLEAVPLGTALKALLAAYDLRVRRVGGIYIIEAKDAPAEAGRPTLVVAQDGTGDCRSIGEAVKRAQPGTLIQIEPGVYRETVVLDKDLELKGDGEAGKVVVEVTGARCLWVTKGAAKVSGMSFRQLAPAVSPSGWWQIQNTVECAGGAQLGLEDASVTTSWGVYHAVVAVGGQIEARRVTVTRTQGDPLGSGLTAQLDGARLVAEDCVVEVENGCGVNGIGGVLELRRCRVKGGQLNVAINVSGAIDRGRQAPPVVEAVDCELASKGHWSVEATDGARCALRGCRVAPSQHAFMARSGALLSSDGCTLTDNRDGAFAVETGGLVIQRNNTLSANDPTIKAAFTGPVLTVAPEGGDYSTIGAAVKAAEPGSLILVRPGRYRESVTINKSIQVRGDGVRQRIVVEQDEQSVLQLLKTASVTVAGLTIRQTGLDRAQASAEERVRFALHAVNVGQLLVADCDVATSWRWPWAAVAVDWCGPSRITGCSLRGPKGLIVAASPAAVEHCRLQGTDRAAMECNVGARVTVEGSTLTGGFIGLECSLNRPRSEAVLTGCDLSENQRYGVWNGNSSSVTLDRCRLSRNVVGVYAGEGRVVTRNTVLTGNAQGAFELTSLSRLEQSGNTYDPADQTVPTAAVVSPTTTVAPDGSGTFKTITEALAHAAPGSTIRLKPGTYREPLKLDFPIELVGEGGREQVIVEAVGQTVAVVTGREVRLKGLTLRLTGPERNPERDWRDTFPLVIDDGGQLTASDCRFTTNWAVWCDVIANGGPSGGGSASFSNCVADGVANGFGAAGGQVVLDGCAARYADAHAGGTLKARRCQFGGASAWGKPDEAPGRVELEDCTVTGSQTAGFITRAGGSAKLVRCTLQQNAGAGLSVAGPGSRVELDHCTVTGNAKGAFELKDGGQISHTGCTFDASDTTIAAAGKP